MRMLKNQKGFTLIELVLVIVVLGILAAVATIQFGSIVTDSKNAALDGAAGPYSAQLAVAINNVRALPTGGAGTGGACTSANSTFDDCVYRLVTISGNGVTRSLLDTGNNSFAVCSFTTCTCPAGPACGTAAAPAAVVCGGATNRFEVIQYTPGTGAMTVSTKTVCN